MVLGLMDQVQEETGMAVLFETWVSPIPLARQQLRPGLGYFTEARNMPLALGNLVAEVAYPRPEEHTRASLTEENVPGPAGGVRRTIQTGVVHCTLHSNSRRRFSFKTYIMCYMLTLFFKS